MICIRNDRSCRQFIIANDIGYSLGISMVAYPQWSSHLLPKVFDLDLLKGSFDELVYLGQDIFLPVFQKFVLLDLWWLRGEQVLALDG